MKEIRERKLTPAITSKLDNLDFEVTAVIDGRYACGQLIGQGASGSVYEGIQLAVNRRVAVKVLNPNKLEDDYQLRFNREAVVVASLNHPSCVTMFDFGFDEELEVLYMVMEYVDGVPLRKARGTSRLEVDRIMEIMIHVTAAIEHAHENGILHRDLKPENILLPKTGVPKVLDFGLAAIAGGDGLRNDDRLTKEGHIYGTPTYMSPEQCRGLADIDGRSDLYSLGIILFEMLEGYVPFHSESVFDILSMQCNDPAPLINSTRVPLPLAEVVAKLLEKKPEDRYQTATELRQALEDLHGDPDGLEYGKSEAAYSSIPLTSFKNVTNSKTPASGTRMPSTYVGDSVDEILDDIGAPRIDTLDLPLDTEQGARSSVAEIVASVNNDTLDFPDEREQEIDYELQAIENKNQKVWIAVAAIALIVLIGGGLSFIFGGKTEEEKPVVTESVEGKETKNVEAENAIVEKLEPEKVEPEIVDPETIDPEKIDPEEVAEKTDDTEEKPETEEATKEPKKITTNNGTSSKKTVKKNPADKKEDAKKEDAKKEDEKVPTIKFSY